MIEKLRRKFIIISMCSILGVLAVIIAAINFFNYMKMSEHVDSLLQILAENNGHFPKQEKKNDHNEWYKPPKMSPEAPFSTRYFTVSVDTEGDILTIDTGKIAAISPKEAVHYTQQALKKGNSTGFVNVYKYAVVDKDEETMIIFLDCRREIETFQTFGVNSILVAGGGILTVFILVVILSKKAVKPVAESFEKQKRFITDAGHEIKTPLTIIDTSTEVLEINYGENEWTNSIRNQVNRLSTLTLNLISLSRMDEQEMVVQMVDFSVSDAVLESAEPFVSYAKAQGKDVVLEIEKNLTLCGNEQAIRQLVGILMDNAVKYAKDNTSIQLTLTRQGRRCVIVVENEADGVSQGNLNQFFERFYRGDSSRNSEKGGYGIGLSIAQAIVTQHKGKIKAESSDGKSVRISVSL